MEENSKSNIIKARILELEDKLMDVIEISSKFKSIPIPVFELEMSEIIKEIEYLESLI